MKAKVWVISWLGITAAALLAIGASVYRIDPFFHYHQPKTDEYFYTLSNQRSQNDGITKHFEYNALLTGTSMTENFRTSEIDEIFGVKSAKAVYSGGTYKELNDNLKYAFETHPEDLKLVFRSLDTSMFLDDKDRLREDLGEYPTYLYDDKLYNDVYYIYNKDVVFSRVYDMVKSRGEEGFEPGITTFDEYSRWQEQYTFGKGSLVSDKIELKKKGKPVHLTDEERETIRENITQNVTSLADEHPDAQFYYFFTPYSILWYMDLVSDGTIYRHIEAEQYIIELILEHENIKLFSFNGDEEIITNLNNYKDTRHYGSWINSYMLRSMHEGNYLLTRDNYSEYIENELKLMTEFDYESLNDQVDFAYDNYTAAVYNQAIWDVEPIDILNECADSVELSDAKIVQGMYNDTPGIDCTGRVNEKLKAKDFEEEGEAAAYILEKGYCGAKITVHDIGKHNYLIFNGTSICGNVLPAVVITDSEGNIVSELSLTDKLREDRWRLYVIDLTDVTGDINIYFNAGLVKGQESNCAFSNIFLY